MSNQNTFRQLSLFALIIAGSVARLNAASFIVTDLADAGPGTLRQAILDANTTPGDDTISFTTNGTITLVTELPAITDNTTITGPGINLLTVSGNNLVRVFYFNADTTNSLSDLTVAAGYASGFTYVKPGDKYPSSVVTNAAGIASAGSLTIQRCVVRDCKALLSYGINLYNSGNLEMNDCTISGSRNPYPYSSGKRTPGGGLFNSGTVFMTNCTITNCSSGGYEGIRGGGGVYNTSNGVVVMKSCRVQNCSGGGSYESGGGILNSGGSLTLENSLIEKCNGWSAGGISSHGTLNMTNSTVRNCGAARGGGIALSGTGLLTGCTIASNVSFLIGIDNEAAGILNSGAQLTMNNCTVSWNRDGSPDYPLTDHLGSGIRIRSSTNGSTILNHCTVISNSGPAEILALGNFSASNSIIGSISGTNNSGGHNLIVDTNGCIITGDTTGDLYNVAPLLGPLRDNGGRTWTHALLPNSPAIDQTDAGGLPTDQRGFARPTAPLTSDLGAFEVVPVTPPTMAISFATPDSVVISWASAPAGFVLQQNAGFDENNWSDLGASQNDDGTKRWVVLPKSGDNTFYQLRLP